MATVIAPSPPLSSELALFHTTDPLLSNSPVLVYHGQAATLGASSSRVQIHILTPAGLASYSRLSVSPNSPFYSAVSNLPREEQGDEIIRGIAFGLKKYFTELSHNLKETWCTQSKAASASALFGDDHVAILATRMSRVANIDEASEDIINAFGEEKLSWLEVDVVLPAGSINHNLGRADSLHAEDPAAHDAARKRYGRYADVVAALGEPGFLPTSKLKRAPSKATAIGRSASFLKQQKEAVYKELDEFMRTEENYVDRLTELDNLSIALRSRPDISAETQLSIVFPESITRMREANQNFLQELRAVHPPTESASAANNETIKGSQSSMHSVSQDLTLDTQDINAFANCLCKCFPQLATCYRDYLQKHAEASLSARTILRDDNPLAAHFQDIGEQKITSLLIEPVQRLPRYNLFIDSIVKQLPLRHPAIKPLLSARDTITEICAEDESAAAATKIAKLAQRVAGWPIDMIVTGRLITAVDYIEMLPPYSPNRCDGSSGMLLLFTDGVVELSKPPHSTLSGRVLLTEIESSLPMPRPAVHESATSDGLTFVRRLKLDAVQCTESHGGHAIQLYTFFRLAAEAVPTHGDIVDSCSTLWLQNAYDGKAWRLVEEICKAKVEGSFSEAERESSTWEFYATEALSDCLGLFSAVYAETEQGLEATRTFATPVSIVVDPARHQTKLTKASNGVRTVISLAPAEDGLWCISVESLDGSMAREYVEASNLSSAIRKKLATLTSVRLAIEQPAMTAALLDRNADILRSIELLNLPKDEEGDKPQLTPREKFRRPRSPKKLLSSFLSSVGAGDETSATLKKEHSSILSPSQIPRIQPPTPQKPPSRESRPSSKDLTTPASVVSTSSNDAYASPSGRLEEVLTTLVLALQARKGNIVGRSLKARSTADELSVNELYNGLLEDASAMTLAAHAPVDVLFAAFEKFLNNAWKEQLGNIVPCSLFKEIQSKAETMFPVDFDNYFKNAIQMLSPQNQRGFRAIIKLLADLLDGTGNDSDRGILTAAFAEVLVTEDDPHKYIALIDRFVDDTDTYFGEPLDEAQKQKDSPHKRSGSVNSASITSNTSSLRRKFGFGHLSRENSKVEHESKTGSVWRSLSKNSRGDNSQNRSQTSDIDWSWHSSRPSSRDGPKAIQSNESPTIGRTNSTHNLGLSTIGEHPSFIPKGPSRKKRRSSLSDLKALEASQRLEPWAAPAVRHPLLIKNRTTGDSALPSMVLPSTPPSKSSVVHANTQLNTASSSRVPPSFRKENSPGVQPELNHQRPKSSGGRTEAPLLTRPTNNIPSLTPRSASPPKRTAGSPHRSGLSERADAGNIVKKPSPQSDKMPPPPLPKASTTAQAASGSPKKLRMQSPQKLRERLHHEKSAMNTVNDSLQGELEKIGDELTATVTPSKPGSLRSSHRSGARSSASQANPMDLAQRVLKMEGQLPSQMAELHQRLNSIQSDLATSLSVSEAKCKKLDELYREANSENEAVYARFNEELNRILKAVRGGTGVEESRKQLKDSQEEAAKLRRETSRLKREIAGLRAQLKE